MKPDPNALPWRPKRCIHMTYELNHYDMPLSGILQHRWTRQRWLFRCLDGASTSRSVWAYVRLSRSDVHLLYRVVGKEQQQCQMRLLFRKYLVIAVAEESLDGGLRIRSAYRARIHHDPEHSWAEIPDLSGTFGAGADPEELLGSLAEGVQYTC